MTYKVYLKSDYKPVIRWTPERPWYLRRHVLLWGAGGFLVAVTLALLTRPGTRPDAAPAPVTSIAQPAAVIASLEPDDRLPDTSADVTIESRVDERLPEITPPVASTWKAIKVAPGDSLSVIFDRLRISPAVMYRVLAASEDTRALKSILPGQELRFLIEEGELNALEYDRDILTTLKVHRQDQDYVSELSKAELITRTREAEAVIDSSLFLAGQRVGMSDNLIMQMAGIYGWDIDFALDIRKGDSFRVIYEEKFKGDLKVDEGPILAAEFINNNKPYQAVRYRLPDGSHEYFSETGASMRKAFLRTPLNFTRISSKFNLSRKHPVLNTIRAHRGVDYAAPSGTPVKAAGDGIITSIGTNGGFGRVIEIRHGSTYSSLYAHLSKYAKGLKKGSRVRQGQVVGYVGMSGLATGPHLHYEFRVNGVHRNPLTVQLPKADSIPAELLDDFRATTAPLLARLKQDTPQEPLMVALRDEDAEIPASLSRNR